MELSLHCAGGADHRRSTSTKMGNPTSVALACNAKHHSYGRDVAVSKTGHSSTKKWELHPIAEPEAYHRDVEEEE